MDAFPCQPQCGSLHEICSSPNISMALLSESDATEHFRWKLMSWPPLGHSNTILYALLIVDNTSFSNFARLNRKSLLRVLTPGRSLLRFQRAARYCVQRQESVLHLPRQ